MSNDFCKYLSNQIRVEYGQLRPCCWFTDSVDVTISKDVAGFQNDLNKIVDWKTAGSRCDECKIREEKKLFSPRLQSFERAAFRNVSDDSKVSLEIQIDKDCNGACLVCGPWNSTTWEKYNNKIKNIPIREVANPKIASDEFVRELTRIIDFSSTREILFLGGEPLRTDSHIQLLQNIQTPEQTIVKYTTNGSYRPDAKTLETWSRFKEIQLQFSIDGIGEHFNYLRWPLQWSQVEDNLRFILDLPSDYIQLTKFSYTTTPLSLYYHNRYEEWANNFFQGTKHKDMFVKPWQPRGETPMRLSATPPRLQHAIKEKYGPDHAIFKLLEPFNLKQYVSFINYLRYHDKHRQTKWQDVFPEMQEFFT